MMVDGKYLFTLFQMDEGGPFLTDVPRYATNVEDGRVHIYLKAYVNKIVLPAARDMSAMTET